MTDEPAKYESVSFVYKEGSCGAYTIMVTKVQPKDNKAFGRLNFPDESFLYQYWNGVGFVGGPKLHSVQSKFTADDDQHLKNLFHAIDTGQIDLSEIQDGEILRPIDIRQMLSNG